MSATLYDSSVRRFPPHLLPPDDLLPEVVPTPKPARPTPGFWAALGWIVVMQLVMHIPFGIAVVLTMIAHPDVLSGGARPTELFGLPMMQVGLWVMFAGHALCALVAVFLLRRQEGVNLGLNRLPIVSLVLAVLCVPGLQFLVGISSVLAQALIGTPDGVSTVLKGAAVAAPWWLLALAIAVGPAINEELWFRGYLGRGLVGRYGPVVGILITSLLFGVYHLSPIQSIYTIVIGVALHLMYLATRSLWVPIVVHFVFNFWAVGLTMLAAMTSASEPAPAASNAPDLGVAMVVTLIGVYAAVVLGTMALAGWGMYRLRVRETA